MARLVITRPNGEVERAELTTDKALAGNDRLTVNKDGTTYYAKLDGEVSTHMFVIKPDGRKLYVQKEIKFIWLYELDTPKKIKAMVIPKTGRYKMTFEKTETNLETMDKNIATTEKQAIFEQGACFGRSSYGWAIIAKNGDEYYLQQIVTQDISGTNKYIEIKTIMKKIEYIGEA